MTARRSGATLSKGEANTRARPRRRLKPAIRRLEILEAAARVMRRMGAAANVEAVVQEAGVSRGAFYLYFLSWDGLVRELRRLVIAEFARRSAEPAGAPPDGDWVGRLLRQAVAFVDFSLALGGLHEALFHGPGPQSTASAPEYSFAPLIADLLTAGTVAGGLAAPDPEPASRLIYAVMHETADAIGAGQDRERSLAAMRQLIQRAVAPVQAASATRPAAPRAGRAPLSVTPARRLWRTD